MMILSPVPNVSPDPDCPRCHGDGIPQSEAHSVLADEWSNMACPDCWIDDDLNVEAAL